MDNKELQTLLRNKVEDLPTKAKRVVEYLLSHMREAAFMSIGDVAEHLDVSKAQMVRVSRMLGFSGYSELKRELKNAVLEQINPSASLGKTDTQQYDVAQKIYRYEHANIDDTWSQITEDRINDFYGLIDGASDIYCLGWGISALVAESFFTRLMELGLRGVLLRRGSLAIIEQARSLKEGDLLIVCELPSYVKEITESVKKAREKKAKIITITDSPAAPICQYSDLSFYVSDMSPTFGSSIVAPLFLVHVLTSLLASHLGDEASAALRDQAEGLLDERIYYPSNELRY